MLTVLLLIGALGDPDIAALPTKLPPAMMAVVQASQPPPPSPPPPLPPALTAEDPDGLLKHLSVGVSVSNAQSTTATKPYVDVMADFPAIPAPKTGKVYPPLRVQVEAQLQGTSAQTSVALGNQLAAGDLSGFYSVSFQGSVHYVISNTTVSRNTVSFQAGVSSVLGSGAHQPTTANPGHAELCFGIWRKDHSASINACPVGFSNEIGDPATVGRADGRVTIGGNVPLRFQVSVIYPYGNAPSNWYAVGTIHNVLTTVAASYDFDKVKQAAAAPPGTTTAYKPRYEAPHL